MRVITVKLTGTSPLLLSADKLANPLDAATKAHKALTSKRKKTDDDNLAIARSQWEGLLYWKDKVGVVVPTQNIRAALIGGAKLNKLGMQIKRGVISEGVEVPLDYGENLTVEQLWQNNNKYADVRSVVVGGARVMAYRPKFENWSTTASFLYDENMLEQGQILQCFTNAGAYVGLGGYRPEKGGPFGRFTVEVIS